MADVSVVIPTHNRAQIVKGAIESVLAQTVPVREILVVNDNSSDDTAEQLQQYGDRIRVFTAAVGGAAGARNIALRVAAGEWIGFLDDDDVWLPNKIERQMMLLKEQPQLGLIFSGDYAVDDALQILHPRAIPGNPRGAIFEKLLLRNFIFQSCAMARRDVIRDVGYMDPDLKFAPDWDLWLKIATRESADFVAEPLALCRHTASGCLTKDIKLADRQYETKLILDRALEYKPLPANLSNEARFELERQCASTWLVEGENTTAFHHALRAIQAKPQALEGYRLLSYSLVPKRTRDWAKQLVNRA